MMRRWLLLAFTLYLTVDLTDPFVAGAFTFDPSECVVALHHRASSSAGRIDASALPVRGPVVRVALLSSSPARPLTGGRHTIVEWLVDAREDTRASGDPVLPSEDH
jgi:hypothetical protein